MPRVPRRPSTQHIGPKVRTRILEDNEEDLTDDGEGDDIRVNDDDD